MYSNLILCNSHQIKNVSKYLINYYPIIVKLSKLGFKKFNKVFKNKKNVRDLLLEYKSRSYEKLKEIFKKSKEKNVIIFCAGSYGKTALKILLNSGAKVDFIVDNNPIYSDGKVIGRATGGNFGFRVNKSLALAMVNPAHSEVGTKLKIDILGDMFDVTVIPESPYDPENQKLRS